jgi:hypothetical protein
MEHGIFLGASNGIASARVGFQAVADDLDGARCGAAVDGQTFGGGLGHFGAEFGRAEEFVPSGFEASGVGDFDGRFCAQE